MLRIDESVPNQVILEQCRLILLIIEAQSILLDITFLYLHRQRTRFVHVLLQIRFIFLLNENAELEQSFGAS